MADEETTVEVRAEPDEHRFEALVEGVHAGYVVYRDHGSTRTFVHTEVDDAFEGMGVGGALARAALDATREAGRDVVAQCPFVRSWIERHPDYQALLAR
jgi:predicted GNAT family acetyltransferase